MSIHKVAVMSDTHNTLRPEALEALKDAEIILHAGDMANEVTLDKLKDFGGATRS